MDGSATHIGAVCAVGEIVAVYVAFMAGGHQALIASPNTSTPRTGDLDARPPWA